MAAETQPEEEEVQGELDANQEAEPEADAGEAEEPDSDDEVIQEEGVEVEEHLKDSVAGSLRLKRLLSRDDNQNPAQKKRKIQVDPEVASRVQLLLKKWVLPTDKVVKHVLEGLKVDELDELLKSSYYPERNNQWKSPCELLAKYVGDLRERKMVGGTFADVVTAFRHRQKLPIVAEQKLRKLTHKELRYVLSNFEAGADLDACIEEAKESEVPDETSTEATLPDENGRDTLGRFSRLELIDPMADCAVFGDANLTFALNLAKHRKALGHVGRVIATTFEEIGTLRERYKEIDASIKTLEDHYAEVYHGVDCTRIAVDSRFEGMENSLGAVYYNFPHSGAVQGFFDGHPIVNWRHENLMRLFFRALRSFVKPGGSVKVASNAGAVGVRYSYIIGGGTENEFEHVETMPFLEWHLHRYGRSYGDRRDAYKRPDATNNQSYNAQRAEADMVYCFIYKPTDRKLPKQEVRMPPTLKTIMDCVDGPFKMLQGAARQNLANEIHKRFETELSGIHVG